MLPPRDRSRWRFFMPERNVEADERSPTLLWVGVGVAMVVLSVALFFLTGWSTGATFLGVFAWFAAIGAAIGRRASLIGLLAVVVACPPVWIFAVGWCLLLYYRP
jgi:hypothetical protein